MVLQILQTNGLMPEKTHRRRKKIPQLPILYVLQHVYSNNLYQVIVNSSKSTSGKDSDATSQNIHFFKVSQSM